MQYFVSRMPIFVVGIVGIGMIVIVGGHIGGEFSHVVGQFSPLTGACIGCVLTFWSILLPGTRFLDDEWQRYERLSWVLIGVGMLLWGAGEACWRYYNWIGQPPFPSIADIGYTSFPVLAFIGLLLQPSSSNQERGFKLTIDSLIVTGTILSLSWYFLLGQLAETAGEASLAKFLGLYYPITDTTLLSCIVIQLLRSRESPFALRLLTLLLMGVGLCFFIASDFVFNVQQNASTYVEATWLDLGWPLGMMTIGLAAYLRRYPLIVPETFKYQFEQKTKIFTFSPVQLIPYLLLACQFAAIIANGLTTDPIQQAIRPVLLFATLGVVSLVVVRQLYTLSENARLLRKQVELLNEQYLINENILRMSKELETGVNHIQEVLTSAANGNYQTRAALPNGHPLWTLTHALNILIIRLARARPSKEGSPL
jgi:hypothetical protein